jgi:hypothetical protein
VRMQGAAEGAVVRVLCALAGLLQGAAEEVPVRVACALWTCPAGAAAGCCVGIGKLRLCGRSKKASACLPPKDCYIFPIPFKPDEAGVRSGYALCSAQFLP